MFKARDNRMLTWAQIRNVKGATGADGGVFLDGPRDVRDPGADGLVNTADDGALAQVDQARPGRPARHGRRPGAAALRVHARNRDSRHQRDAAAAPRHRALPLRQWPGPVRPHHLPVLVCVSDDSGFTLGEALIALALTLVVIGAGMTAFTRALEITDTARLMSETPTRPAGGDEPDDARLHPDGPGHSARRHPDSVRRRRRMPILRPAPPGATLTSTRPRSTLPAVSPGGEPRADRARRRRPTSCRVLYADPTLALNQFPLAAIAADGSTMTVNAGTPITGVDGIKVGDLDPVQQRAGQRHADGHGGQRPDRVRSRRTIRCASTSARRRRARSCNCSRAPACFRRRRRRAS